MIIKAVLNKLDKIQKQRLSLKSFLSPGAVNQVVQLSSFSV